MISSSCALVKLVCAGTSARNCRVSVTSSRASARSIGSANQSSQRWVNALLISPFDPDAVVTPQHCSAPAPQPGRSSAQHSTNDRAHRGWLPPLRQWPDQPQLRKLSRSIRVRLPMRAMISPAECSSAGLIDGCIIVASSHAQFLKDFVEFFLQRRGGKWLHHIATGPRLRRSNDVLFLRFCSHH